jgi:glycosyltransferase 2 family protein
VRESLLAFLLGSGMTSSAAFAVVLLSRFAVTLGDVLLAGGGWVYARRHRLLSAHPGPMPVPEGKEHRLG